MPHDVPTLLAEPQIYVMLAITVATFGWMFKPDADVDLDRKGVHVIAGLLFLQGLHLALYAPLQKLSPFANSALHFSMIAVYIWALLAAYLELLIAAKSRPPNSPS